MPLAGGAVVSLAHGTAVASVAVDATNVYWADLAGIMSVPLAGGTPTTVAAASASVLVTDGTSLYWTTSTTLMKLTPK